MQSDIVTLQTILKHFSKHGPKSNVAYVKTKLNGRDLLNTVFKSANDKTIGWSIYFTSGGSANDKTNYQYTLLVSAIRYKCPADVIQLLITETNLDITDIYGQIPILNAVYYGHDEKVIAMLKTATNCNIANNCGVTALSHAADTKSISYKVVELLITDTNRDFVDIDGNTPLHCAVRSGQPQRIIIMLITDANRDLANFNGDTPLMLARKFNKAAVCLFGGEEETLKNDEETLKNDEETFKNDNEETSLLVVPSRPVHYWWRAIGAISRLLRQKVERKKD